MAKKREIVRLSRGDRLRDSPRQPTSMTMPLAVHRRLELLAEAAVDVQPTRAEIIAMLIAETEIDAEKLEGAIMRYRKLTVGQVVPEQDPADHHPKEPPAGGNVVSIARPQSGRPAAPRRG